jgi:hypothetical protein
MRLRPLRYAGIALLLALVVSALFFRPWLAAQGRSLVVLVSAVDVPVLGWVLRVVTDEPRFEETELVGVPATVVRPGGGNGPWPAVVFFNGATARGRHHPQVRRLASGLARAGYVVYVPDPHGLSRGEITPRTLADSVAVARAAADGSHARDGHVALAGVSVGTTLSLLVAEDPTVSSRVSLVAGIAPYADLREVIRLATTGRHLVGGRLLPHQSDSFVGLVVSRSLAAGLPPGQDRDALLGHLLRVDDDADAPLVGLESWPRGRLGDAARAVLDVLLNDDPERFDALFAALPSGMRENMSALSPLRRVAAIEAPVELASAPRDKYFPLSDSRSLAAAARQGRLTVTETLDHAVPSASLHEIADLFRFYGFLVRSLKHAAE